MICFFKFYLRFFNHMPDDEMIEKARSIAHMKKLTNDCASGQVGCVLITEKGNEFIGVSFYSASGLGTCAEHGAVQNMLAHGENHVKKIVAVRENGNILPPCGRCRELLFQICRQNLDTDIIIKNNKTLKLRELLPHRWQDADGKD